MNIKDYVALKAASKVSFGSEKVTVREKEVDSDGNVLQAKEERDAVFITEKAFNVATGEALSDIKREVQLREYESDKARYEDEKARAQVQIDALTQIITDIKAL
mgnify:FL=1